MVTSINRDAIDQLFTNARTHNSWLKKSVNSNLLREIWDLARMGPTSANCSPARILFIVSDNAKERLKQCLIKENIEKTISAPVTAIIGSDQKFYESLSVLFPHTDARSWFVGNEPLIETTAFRNSSLQGAYFMLAARALGLDCGPISGFDNEAVDASFFDGTDIKSNFLCNIGYGSGEDLFERSPRLEFNVACQLL
jgi:nitroreductase